MMPLHYFVILRGLIEVTFSLLRQWFGSVIPAPAFQPLNRTSRYNSITGYIIPNSQFSTVLKKALKAATINASLGRRIHLLLDNIFGYPSNAIELSHFRNRLHDLMQHLRGDFSNIFQYIPQLAITARLGFFV